MNIALRFLPPLSVIAAFAVSAVLLRPRPPVEAELQHSICLELPIAETRPTLIVELARGDLEGCFAEWNERRVGDAEVRVRLHVNDGVGTAETEDGPDSPGMWLCASEAIARIDFPDQLYTEADVLARWTNGRLTLSMGVLPESRERTIEIARDRLEKLRRRKAELEHQIERQRQLVRAQGH